MNIYDKFTRKYGAHTVMLPPPPESLEEQEIIVEPENQEELEDLSFKNTPAPVIKQPTEKEMKHWEHWLASKDNLKGFNMGESAGESDSTVPPRGKKALTSSPEQILKSCSKYYDLCRKF